MQDGCKVYMDSYMASNGSCFMVTWIIFKNRLLEVGLTQNQETHGTLNAHYCCFILFYHVWGPAWIEIHWNGIWLRAWSHMTSHYTWGSVTTLHDFGGVLGRPLDTFFWALTNSWSWLLARVWSGPNTKRENVWMIEYCWEFKYKLLISLGGIFLLTTRIHMLVQVHLQVVLPHHEIFF